MERREDSTLTSPYVTPFGRSSMTAVCRGDKTEDEKQSGFSWFLFTPFSNTTVFYTYILSLLLFSPILFCNSFIPPFTLIHSLLFFKFLQLPHGRRLRRWCCPFLPSHTLGTSLREWYGSGLARRKPSEYLPESLRADSPAWLTSPVATPKRAPLNDGCRLWGLGGTDGKAFRHPTFHVFLFAHGQRERHRELSADGQSPQEYVGCAGQMTSICPSLPMHTCFVGLPSLLFSVLR